MSKVLDIHGYTHIKKKIKETEDLVKVLDNIAKTLYNNLGNDGIFKLIEHTEELLVDYYVRYDYYQEELRKYGQEKS